MTDTLTRPYSDDMSKKMQRTSPGMAHWAGTGPDGKTCRLCLHFKSPGHYAAGKTGKSNRLKPGACGKYKTMMGKPGAKFEHKCAACMFFEEHPSPPLVFAKSR